MFAKIFQSLWDGSMVGMPDPQLVFVFLLAHCDREGFVDKAPNTIAALTGIPIERVTSALLILESADPASRSPDEGGRRIIRQDDHRAWGWQIVNHGKYAALRNSDGRREEARERMRRTRANKSEPFADVRHRSPLFAHVDVDVDVDAEEPTPLASAEAPAGGLALVNGSGKAPQRPQDAEVPLGEWMEPFPDLWRDYPRKVARTAAERAYAKIRPRTQATCDLIFAGLDHYLKNVWPGRPADKIEHMSTWLNQRRFDDAAETKES